MMETRGFSPSKQQVVGNVWQAIKVTTDNDVSFWLRGRNNGIRQVRIYSKDKKYFRQLMLHGEINY